MGVGAHPYAVTPIPAVILELNMGDFAKSFRDLDVYQESLDLALEIHAFAKTLPAEEKYVLADQMRRASRSVTEAAEMQCWLDFSIKARAFTDSNTVTHPGLRPPLRRRGAYKIPSTGGVPERRGGFLDVLRNNISIVKCSKYMDQIVYQDFDQRYERIISQLVTMIDGSDKWCR
jgi:hypothetical protein